jgi:hypothetical protein
LFYYNYELQEWVRSKKQQLFIIYVIF